MAVSHILLEYVQLSYEAKACKTTVINYSIACFNGRFGWVPFVEDLTKIADQLEKVEEDKINELVENNMVLDFDNISYSNLFVSCEVPFKFSDAGASTLCLKVDELPDQMRH